MKRGLLPRAGLLAAAVLRSIDAFAFMASRRPSFGGAGSRKPNPRSRYTGAELRAIRARNGIGRPLHWKRKRDKMREIAA